ncbi:hypothetical protein [Flavobacterium sp. 3HN19-14]|uniref:hypothetical protein n=1 Tax=Flavobacterium sp. 3HN19-14 TaxID=3448133 RepID=UPI003EE15B4F
MRTLKFDKYEIENLEDCIPEIEKMYQFQFTNEELKNVKSFDEFSELIISKIDFENIESCTTQQAFYKLRKSVVEENVFKKENFKPETKLNDLFPRENRIKVVRKIENNIGFKLNILNPPVFIFYILFPISIISFVTLFIDLKIGILGCLFSIFSIYLSNRFAKEIRIKNVKQLVEKITNENYLKVRKKQNTVNKSELKKVLIEWFADNACIEKEKLEIGTFI